MISSEQIAEHKDRCTSIAKSLTGIARKANVLLDDIEQEGLIQVWLSLDCGEYPSDESIRNRMIRWINYEKNQNRLSTVSYIEAMGEE